MNNASQTIPDNIRLLNPNGFLFGIQKYPELNYFMQSADLPSIDLGQAQQFSSVHDLKVPGETLTFSDLTIKFLVDENMENYIAVQEWMFGLGYPEGSPMFANLLGSPRNAQSYSTASKTVSDCFLTVLGNDNNPLHRFIFVDAFPTSLSGLSFQSTNTDVQYFEASLTLAYSYYKRG